MRDSVHELPVSEPQRPKEDPICGVGDSYGHIALHE